MGEKTRTITLSNRPPVKVREDEWPLVASSLDYDNEFEFQANSKWRLKVRRHADGRAIVYGTYDTALHEPNVSAGELLSADEDVVAAIRRVGEEIGASDPTIRRCIADLPAEEI